LFLYFLNDNFVSEPQSISIMDSVLEGTKVGPPLSQYFDSASWFQQRLEATQNTRIIFFIMTLIASQTQNSIIDHHEILFLSSHY